MMAQSISETSVVQQHDPAFIELIASVEEAIAAGSLPQLYALPTASLA
jgi:hypothetical protein